MPPRARRAAITPVTALALAAVRRCYVALTSLSRCDLLSVSKVSLPPVHSSLAPLHRYNHRSVILADEMGLGKTAQAIAMLDHIWRRESIRGPFLVIAPLSTLAHWQREIEEWTDLSVLNYYGRAESRDVMHQYEWHFEGLTTQPSPAAPQMHAISGHQWQPSVPLPGISGHQWPSVAISGSRPGRCSRRAEAEVPEGAPAVARAHKAGGAVVGVGEARRSTLRARKGRLPN